MRRVTSKNGTVAVYIWDYAGKMEFLNHFWNAVVELNPGASNLHEGLRFPDSNAEQLIKIFKRTGFSQIVTTPLDIVTGFRNFDDYWQPFLGGQGPAPTYVAQLNESDRNRLSERLRQMLAVSKDDPISLSARAWAAKGTV